LEFFSKAPNSRSTFVLQVWKLTVQTGVFSLGRNRQNVFVVVVAGGGAGI